MLTLGLLVNSYDRRCELWTRVLSVLRQRDQGRLIVIREFDARRPSDIAQGSPRFVLYNSLDVDKWTHAGADSSDAASQYGRLQKVAWYTSRLNKTSH